MDLAPFRNRDYRLLYAAQFVSLLGTMVTYVALPYQMYRLTGSSLSVGLLGLFELVPLLATAFIGGVMADAVDRRRIAIATDVALAGGSAALALIAMKGASPWLLYLVAAWMSAVSGLQRPAIESLVPRLVTKDELPAAASLAVVRGSVGMIAGPAIGGVLIASAGLTLTYLTDVASYALSLVPMLIRAVRRPKIGAAEPTVLRFRTPPPELIGTVRLHSRWCRYRSPFRRRRCSAAVGPRPARRRRRSTLAESHRRWARACSAWSVMVA
jgi:MFS family permease